MPGAAQDRHEARCLRKQRAQIFALLGKLQVLPGNLAGPFEDRPFHDDIAAISAMPQAVKLGDVHRILQNVERTVFAVDRGMRRAPEPFLDRAVPACNGVGYQREMVQLPRFYNGRERPSQHFFRYGTGLAGKGVEDVAPDDLLALPHGGRQIGAVHGDDPEGTVQKQIRAGRLIEERAQVNFRHGICLHCRRSPLAQSKPPSAAPQAFSSALCRQA